MTADTLRRTFIVLHDGDAIGPVCIENDHGLCGEPATHEVFCDAIDTTWGAKCTRCSRYYNPKAVSVRELTKARADMHELAQWRAGTIRRSSDKVGS